MNSMKNLSEKIYSNGISNCYHETHDHNIIIALDNINLDKPFIIKYDKKSKMYSYKEFNVELYDKNKKDTNDFTELCGHLRGKVL